MKSLYVFIALTLFIAGCSPSNPTPNTPITITPSPAALPQQVNYHAAFAIFTNGTKRKFIADMYLHQSPTAFLESNYPEVIQLKQADVTWQQFFDTLPFRVTQDCLYTGTKEQLCNDSNNTLKFFLNSKPVSDLLNRTIQDGDQVLVSYGDETGIEIERQINQIPNPNIR